MPNTTGSGRSPVRKPDRSIMRLSTVSITAGFVGGAVALAAAVYPASAQLSPTQLSPTQLSAGQAAPGTITTIAGGIGGPGRPDRMALASPCAIVSDNGASYFTDQTQQGDTVIRKIVDELDHLTTVMGASTSGINPDGAPAGRGNPDQSCGVAVDSGGGTSSLPKRTSSRRPFPLAPSRTGSASSPRAPAPSTAST